MYKKVSIYFSFIALCAFGSIALAQPGLVVGTGSGAPGSMVSISVDYLGTGSTVVGIQADIGFTGTNFSAIDLTGCGGTLGGAGISCSMFDANTIRVAGFDGLLNEIPSGSLGNIVFTINPAVVVPPSQVFPLTVANEQYGNAASMPVAPVGTVNGSVTAAAGPTLDSSGAVALSPLANGSDNAMFTVTANGGTVSTIACSTTGDSQIVVTGSVPATLNDTQSATLTATCTDNSGMVGTMYNATHSCTSSASNSPTTTAISCTSSAGTANASPPGNSNTSLTVGPVVRGNAGSSSITFRETNNQGVSYDVSCVISNNGGGAFTAVSALAGTVPAGGSLPVTISGQSSLVDPQPVGQMDCTYSNGETGTVTVALGIAIQPEIVPTLGQWGLILMILALIAVGMYTLRRRVNYLA